MIRLAVIIVVCCIASSAWSLDVGVITVKSLPELKGEQEFSMVSVEYEPGEMSQAHRHNAHTFVYMLEGSIVMQVEGGEKVTLNVGDDFYENPDDIHTVSKNASQTEGAKFLVVYLKPQGVTTQLVE